MPAPLHTNELRLSMPALTATHPSQGEDAAYSSGSMRYNVYGGCIAIAWLDRHVRKARINVVHSQNARCVSAPGQGPVDVTSHTAVPVPVSVTCETAPHSLPSLSSTVVIGQPQSPGEAVNLRLPST